MYYVLDLVHHGEVIGSLTLGIDQSKAFHDSMRTVLVYLLFQGFAVITVALFLVGLYDKLVIRHLSTAATYFATFDLGSTTETLRLNKPDRRDEIDLLVESFNFMHDNLAGAYELRVAKDAAEQANEAKSAFLANMSHEIRTPLNAILGFAQVLVRDAGISPQQKEKLNTIIRSGEHLLSLINSILDLSKIEANRVEVHPAAFNLRFLLKEIELLFRQKSQAKGIALRCTLHDNLPAYVKSDEGKVRQVLINLVGNAIKFTASGSVTIRADASESGTEPRELRVEVEDTGIGIAPEEMDKLFRKFQQAEAGLNAGSGTGLGLTISQQLARLMGGDITVQSERNKGSCFTLTLPLIEADASEAFPGASREERQIEALAPGQPAARILVVDDISDNRELLREILERVGYETYMAENGHEAVECFGQWLPDLVLTDLVMPVMDGYEEIRLIRARPKGKNVKIIAISASSLGDIRSKAIEAGADDFIPKPFREYDLLEKIARLLGVTYTYASTPHEISTLPEGPAPDGEGVPEEQALALLDPGSRTCLRDAAIKADMDRMTALVQEFRAVLGEHNAQSLMALIERFEFPRLIALLDKTGEGT